MKGRKNMKRKYKSLMIISSLIVSCSIIVIIGMHSTAVNRYEKINSQTSEEEREIYSVSEISKDVIQESADYDPTIIDKDAISEKAKKMADVLGKDKKQLEKEIMNDAERTKALYLAAKDYGITVSDSEVDEILNELKNALHSSEDGEEQLNAALAGLDMSEDEYWETSRAQYETNIYIDKYLDARSEEINGEKIYEKITPDSIDVRNNLIEQITNEALEKYIK